MGRHARVYGAAPCKRSEACSLHYRVVDQVHFTAIDAMDLALLTGQRPADVLKLKGTDIRDGALWIVQNKTGQRRALGWLTSVEKLPEM